MAFVLGEAVVRGRHARSSWLTRVFRLAWNIVLLLGFALPAAAQVPGTQNPQTPPPPGADRAADPLGRQTPRGTIAGFNLAVTRNDFVAAARFLQVTAGQGPSTETLTRQLTELMDRYFTQSIAGISDAPEGAADDGLAPNREQVALLRIGTRSLEIRLVRVDDQQAGPIWLIAAETLAQVPAAHRSMEATWLERLMPETLVKSTVFGISVARWIAWTASIGIPLILLWLLFAVIAALARKGIHDPTRLRLFDSWRAGLRWPMIVAVTLGVHLMVLRFLGFSLRFRLIYAQFAFVVSILVLTWLLWRLSALSFVHARLVAQRRGQAGIRSLLMLAERVVMAVIVLLAIFSLLTIAGVDTTAALAGVGIGGVALALGAQKSVENLLGGVFLLTDKALAVGDTCSISNRVGVIEDITLRSVRLRTVEQTLLSVPAGVLAQESIENFATRHKILAQSTLRLRYGTTADQLRLVLSRIRTLLAEHPKIEAETYRIQLLDFGIRAIELELFAYVLTADMAKFLSVREDLLLQIAAIVESSGSGFAQPAEFVNQA